MKPDDLQLHDKIRFQEPPGGPHHDAEVIGLSHITAFVRWGPNPSDQMFIPLKTLDSFNVEKLK
jgi:hypothetical protein